MPGKYQYDIELKSNVAKLLTDMKEVQDRLDTVEGKEYKIKLNIDEKKLSNVISNLEKMLDSLGKGTGDFKQFENLSKELSSIVSEVQNLSKAFGKVDDSGTKTLLSLIQNIDKSLSELNQHILNVNKNMSNIGGDTNSTVKQVENISNAYDNASKSAEKLVEAQSKIGNKSNISSENDTSSIVQSQEEIRKEIEETNLYIDKQSKKILELNKLINTNDSVSNKKQATDNLRQAFYALDGSTFNKDGSLKNEKIIKYNKAYNNAKEIGVAQSALSKYYNGFAKNAYNEAINNIKRECEIVKKFIDESTNKVKELNAQLSDSTSASPVDDASSNNQIVENQNKIQVELKQTQEQAEQTAKSVQEVSETPIKDVIQGETEKSGKDAVSSATEEAAQAQKDFATANEKAQSSADGSKTPLQLEAELMESIAKNAREAANAKKEFTEANKQVKDSAESSSTSIDEENIKFKEVGESTKNPSESTKDVFQDSTSSAEKLEESVRNIESATDKASESLKEYKNGWKILSQVGETTDDSFSATYEKNKGQIEVVKWKAKRDKEGNYIYDKDGNKEYTESSTTISNYQKLEKTIIEADNALRRMEADKEKIIQLDSNASTTFIDTQIREQKEYIKLLEQTITHIANIKNEVEKKDGTKTYENAYLINEQAIRDAREKAKREYELSVGSKGEMSSAKQSASDEKKRLANIEQVNRALNKQQIAINAIEKTYNKAINPDLDREVSNQQDLAELARKKLEIQTRINSLQGKERNSSNEKEFLELEKLIAEYKELAKYKLKANNPSKQELGGQNLQTLIQVQISSYDKLITKAEKYGDATSKIVENLKKQRRILSEKDQNTGRYTATADQYYTSRDTYKVESASLSAYETQEKASNKARKEVNEVNNALQQEAERQANAQKKKWDAFLKEQQSYIGNKQETDAINRNQAVFQELKYAIKEYSKVSTRILSGNALDGDVELAQKLEDKILNLQKQPILSPSQVEKSERDLVNLFNQLDIIEKKVQQSAQNQIVKEADNQKLEQQKRIYQELNDKINRYATIAKRIASKSAYSTDEEDLARLQARIEELRNEPLLSEEQLDKSQKKLDEIETTVEDIQKRVVNTTLDNLQGDIDSYYKRYDNYSIKPKDVDRNPQYTKDLEEYKSTIDKLASEKQRLNDLNLEFITEDDLKNVRQIESDLAKIEKRVKGYSAAEKGSDEQSRLKQIDKINKYLEENTRISQEAKYKLRELLQTLENDGAAANVKKINEEFIRITNNELAAGRAGKTFMDVLKDKRFYSFAGQIASYFSFYDIINVIRRGAQEVRELNKALTEMRKVSDESLLSLKEYQNLSFDMGDEVGTTGKQIMESTADWLRLGESMKEASKSASTSNILLNVSEFESIDEATESLVSMSQAYKDLDKIEIVDVLNNLGKLLPKHMVTYGDL